MAFNSSASGLGRKGSQWMNYNYPVSPAILESIDSLSLSNNRNYQVKENEVKRHGPSLPDITHTSEFTSLELSLDDQNGNVVKAFQLLDSKECIKVGTAEEFCVLLGLKPMNPNGYQRVKVVTIIGNTGDGKSHTMNHIFFNGEEVFKTSPEQSSCTIGIYAAYSSEFGVICLDTEGLMGSIKAVDAQYRTRLLVKVLAVSDIVIYRTRSDRLHDNMYKFLSSASHDYTNHLQSCLEMICKKNELGGTISSLGPSILIFHETRHTKPLTLRGGRTPEDTLRKNFKEMGLSFDAFSSLCYIGQQTQTSTDYSEVLNYMKTELANTTVRSPRNPKLVYNILRTLNDRFSGKINTRGEVLPDEYFTCPSSCLSCDKRCQLSMGHISNGQQHFTKKKCRYQHQYENIFYVCKICYSNGKEVRVTPKYSTTNDGSWFEVITKYAWSGYVIECPNCGEIYRSRQYWYGNTPPEDTAVRTEIHHIWPGMLSNANNQNSAQRVIDGVAYFTEAVVSASATPTKALSSWVSDQVAPKYWKPNVEISKCNVCGHSFTMDMKIHHCRVCGEGVCATCSSRKKSVPEKGWEYPVRVCDFCFAPSQESQASLSSDSEVMPRKVTEAVVTTFSTLGSLLNYPKSMIKETARPSYWVPDSEARDCCVCQAPFQSCGGTAALHHCRSCGGAVCGGCSTGRKSVPHRGWDTAVRVCDNCFKC
ncbi:zinc finger FYVE domain-containing protein 1-like [Cimex lectularius]|uniref:FYVE-type domain-containing protein n=1 Tax=Cimex lectularius TaxID=79782 RepID=A0A8I6RG83_CIMLE|nr:zinc finger FYVE domain-containing protein 1-like [Cimex lectularius]